MIEYGFGARQFRDHKITFPKEVDFARRNHFDLIQVWYDTKDGLAVRPEQNKEELIRGCNFSTIIHAVLDITEIKGQASSLVNIAKHLGHKQLIIHPQDKSGLGIRALSDALKKVLELFISNGITLFIENNSRFNPILYKPEEINYLFSQLPKLELLLDIAHIDNYEHLKKIVEIKVPKILHIADSHFDVDHEHIPVGEGEIDFKYVFKEILPNFDGKIIFEVTQSEEALLKSKNIITSVLG